MKMYGPKWKKSQNIGTKSAFMPWWFVCVTMLLHVIEPN